MHKLHPFTEVVKTYLSGFNPVVPFNKKMDKLLLIDFTELNSELTDEILKDTELFSEYINSIMEKSNAKYGIGGYNEHRTIYSRSELFGPSPTTIMAMPDGAKAPSRWEGDEERESLVEEETVGYRNADPSVYGLLKEHALRHRKVPTKAEEILWELIKTKQLGNYKFRRQHIIDRFIADFVCLKMKLVIEVDGLIHQLPENQLSDEQRTNRLNELGFEVIRFTNNEVLHDLDKVLRSILCALEKPKEKKDNSELSSPTGGQGASRTVHLGIDIWGEAITPVYAPMQGVVHSFNFNNAFGDYGATIILQHTIEGFYFHTLYGHLSLKSIQNLKQGESVEKGQWIASFGEAEENGHWPPHLHFQIVIDMEGRKGDYPGVCKSSERETYLANCPDPDLILGMMNYAIELS